MRIAEASKDRTTSRWGKGLRNWRPIRRETKQIRYTDKRRKLLKEDNYEITKYFLFIFLTFAPVIVVARYCLVK